MAEYVNIYDVDLTRVPARVNLKPMYYNNQYANRIGVNVFRGDMGVILDSANGECTGTVILKNGVTVEIDNGAIIGNQMYFDLPVDAYAVEGPVRIFLTYTDDGVITTMLEGFGIAKLSESGEIVDPGTIIPSVGNLIYEIESAVASIPASAENLKAAIAETFDSQKAYVAGDYVWNEGVLYKFTEDHVAGSWIGTDAEEADIGTYVSYLKNLINTKLSIIADCEFEDTTNQGVTLTNNGNHSITLTGTATDGFIFVTNSFLQTFDCMAVLTGKMNGSKVYSVLQESDDNINFEIVPDQNALSYEDSVFALSSNKYYRFYIASLTSTAGETFDLTFSPILALGGAISKDTLFPNSLFSIKSSKQKDLYFNDESKKGVTLTVNEDESITLNGEITEIGLYFVTSSFKQLQNTEVILTGKPSFQDEIGYLTLQSSEDNINFTICEDDELHSQKDSHFNLVANTYYRLYIVFENTAVGETVNDTFFPKLLSGEPIKEANNRLAGKTIITFGDSITWYDGNVYNWGDEEGQKAVGYQSYLRDELHMKVANYGRSGWTMPQICNNLIKAFSSFAYDYCTITSGANDERCGVQVGEAAPIGSTFDTTTYIGSLQSAIEYILNKNPLIKIILMTPIRGWIYAPNGYDDGTTHTVDGEVTEKWANAIKEVGKIYDFPVLDWYNNCGFNLLTRDAYINDPEPPTNTLYSLHPNSKGYKRMAALLVSFIQSV